MCIRDRGKTLLVAGDKNHPEVQGIVGHTRGSVFVFADLEELKALLTPENTRNGIFVVAQTTFEVKKWQECVEFLKKVYTNPVSYTHLDVYKRQAQATAR